MGKEVNEQQMSRRRFLRAMAFGSAAIAAGMLAACGTATPSAEAPAAGGDAPATGEVAKIKAMMWSNSPVLDENFKWGYCPLSSVDTAAALLPSEVEKVST